MSDHLTVPQVLSWNPASLTEQAGEWDRQADTLRARMDAQNGAVDGSHETFRGKAGDAMRDRFGQVYEKSRKVLQALEDGGDAARIGSMNVASAKGLVQHQKQAAEAKGFRVEPDGTCNITEQTKQAVYSSVLGDANRYNTAMAALRIDCDSQTTFMKNVLDNAARVDNDAVTAIQKAFADLPTPDSFGNATTPKTAPAPPPKNGSPKENRAWWDSLTPQQQGDLVSTQPASVGNLDGLPANARDAANRNLIPIEKARLEREVAINEALAQTSPSLAGVQSKIEDGKKRLDDLKAVEEQIENKPNQAPRKLMYLDMQSGRQGRAAIAVGDPDNADHVSVTAPGLNSNLRESLNDMMGEATALRTESERQLRDGGHAGESVSTIAWVGYDPPQGGIDKPQWDTTNVMWQGRAEEGAKPLADFYNGLDVASGKNDPHITALGHSYGSLTTSLALQEKPEASMMSCSTAHPVWVATCLPSAPTD